MHRKIATFDEIGTIELKDELKTIPNEIQPKGTAMILTNCIASLVYAQSGKHGCAWSLARREVLENNTSSEARKSTVGGLLRRRGYK